MVWITKRLIQLLLHISLGKGKEWLSLDSQQMSHQVPWNLTGPYRYIPEQIPMVQITQYTDWPSLIACSPSLELERSPTLAQIESGKGEHLQMVSRGGREMDAGKADLRWMLLCLIVPPIPLGLLVRGRMLAPCPHVLLGGRNANSPNWRALYSEGPFTHCSIRLMKHKLINS